LVVHSMKQSDKEESICISSVWSWSAVLRPLERRLGGNAELRHEVLAQDFSHVTMFIPALPSWIRWIALSDCRRGSTESKNANGKSPLKSSENKLKQLKTFTSSSEQK
jgi:hypothetical protein